MAEKSLDIPVSDLPFEAGQGFSATVDEGKGIAHILVTVAEETQKKSSETITAWLESLKNLPRKNGISEEDRKDQRYIDLLKKHSPSYLKEHAPDLLD